MDGSWTIIPCLFQFSSDWQSYLTEGAGHWYFTSAKLSGNRKLDSYSLENERLECFAKPPNWNPENHLNQTSIFRFQLFIFPRCNWMYVSSKSASWFMRGITQVSKMPAVTITCGAVWMMTLWDPRGDTYLVTKQSHNKRMTSSARLLTNSYCYSYHLSFIIHESLSKKTKCRGNLAMKRVRIQTHSKSTNIIFKYHTNKLTQGLMTTSTQLTPDDSKSLYRKWLFHQTSIYKWLFGFQADIWAPSTCMFDLCVCS